MAKKAKTAAERVKAAKKKRNELIDKGVAFNPKGISESGRQHAASNQRTRGLKGTAAAAKIREGRAGTATAKKGKSATHKRGKKRG